jgi:hypothetical protein
MSNQLLLAALLATGCTNQYLDLIHARANDPNVGQGLEAVFDAVIRTCDPGDVYPAGCELAWSTISNVRAKGPVEISSFGAHRFRVVDRGGLGTGEVTVDTVEGLSETYDITVIPIAYSTITWLDRYFSYGPFKDSAPLDRLGPAFANTTIELNQTHYRESREQLAERVDFDVNDVILNGNAPFTIESGTTQAELVDLPWPDPDRDLWRFPRVGVRTGTTLGTAHVSTDVGGELVVDVVDPSAIASLGTYTGEPLDEYDYDLRSFTIYPRDAQGRHIAGCPVNGPTVTDDKGLIVASFVESEHQPYCVLRFEFAPNRRLEPTTIVITWNGVELRVPFEPLAE